MAFDFGIDLNIKPSDQKKVQDNILITEKHTDGKKHLLLLIDVFPPSRNKAKAQIDSLMKAKLPDFDYDAVVATKLNYTLDEVKKKGIYKFYKENHSDFRSYIRENTVILSFGYSLQAITESDDLNLECFYDYVFNKTYFYSPSTRTNVFPVDGLNVLYNNKNTNTKPSDCSRSEFMYLQLSYIGNHYNSLNNPPTPKRYKIVKISDEKEWKEFYDLSKSYKKISIDLETTGLHHKRNKIGCITVSFDGITGYYIPWSVVNKEELSEILKGKYQIGTNKKFDDKFLIENGITNVYTHSDCLHLGHLLNEMRFNGLKSLAYYYTQHGGYDKELDEYKDKFKIDNYMDIPEQLLMKYATQDAIHSFNIEAEMQKQLTELDERFPPKRGWWKVRDLYEKIIVPYINVFTDIEVRGFNVDMEKWNLNAQILQQEITKLKEPLRVALKLDTRDEGDFFGNLSSGTKDELDSGKKLGEILERLGWENLGRTKLGWYKTGDDELERWLQLGHKEAKLIQEMRSLLTLQKTFMGIPNDNTMGWKEHVIDGKIYPTYNPMLMDTYRNGCHSPNYQQIPSSSLKADLFKQVLAVPDKEKYYMVTLDYSGAQLRLATIDCKEPVLLEGYKQNQDLDVHSKTAFNVFCRGALFNIDEIIVEEEGKIRTFFPFEQVRIRREGKDMKVKAEDLKESDTILA